MNNRWPELNQFTYPGRFLIIARSETKYYLIYGVTARSASSRAKRYIFDKNTHTILVEPTDLEIMSQGDLDLLSYNAAHIYNNAIIMGNGRQTDLIKIVGNSVNSLTTSLQSESMEPDKYNTPRITGALINTDNQTSAGLHIIRENQDEQISHEAYDLVLQPGQGYFLSTYAGPNTKPTPSFLESPILINIDFENVQAAAQKTYDYFAPKQNEPDLRVSVVAIETDLTVSEKAIAIINYNK